MNWHAIGAIGQILGSLATFVTVGYLVVQVHDTETEMQRSIAQSRAERNLEVYLAAATNERLAAIHVKANTAAIRSGAAPGSKVFPFLSSATEQLGLSPQETLTLHWEHTAKWGNIAQTVLYMDELLPADRVQFDGTTHIALSEPIFRVWYERQKSTLNPQAVRYVDNLLAQPG